MAGFPRFTGFALIVCLGTWTWAGTEPLKPKPWDHLGEHMARSLVGWPTLLHASAAGSTWLILEQGVDADVLRAAAAQDATVNGIWFAPLLVSTFAPVAAPAALYWLPDDPETQGAGAAAMQAVALGFLYNNLLKAVTGRLPPESDHPDPEGLSHGFQFGFLRGGLFNGWPSGHMMVNSSLAASLAAYYPDRPWVRWGALAYALAVGGAVTYGARGDIHWISDSVAGGLMGLGVGWTVGAGFRRHHEGRARASRLSIHPVAGARTGLAASLSLR